MKTYLFAIHGMAHSLALLCCASIITVLLPSCASSTSRQEPAKQQELATVQQRPLYEWHATADASGPAKIRISLDEQKAYIYQGGQQTAWTYLATGRGGFGTPQGTYHVMEKRAQKSSSKYGMIVDAEGNVIDSDATLGVERIPPGGRFVGAPMPYWMRLTGTGIGMHAGHIPNPGLPASHGCIRLPRDMAARLYEVVDVGTQVTISGSTPQG